MLGRLVERQLGRPSALAGRLMNVANARINRTAIELLEIAPEHRVLEVGFGGGAVLAELARRAAFVGGIDPSAAAVSAARRRLQPAVAEGRLDAVMAEVESIPFPAGAFDRVLAVNTIYFWTKPERGLEELRRVLHGDGRIVVAVERRTVPWFVVAAGFRIYTETQLVELLARAGFSQVRSERRGRHVFALATNA